MYFSRFLGETLSWGSGIGDLVTGRTDVSWFIWFAFFLSNFFWSNVAIF